MSVFIKCSNYVRVCTRTHAGAPVTRAGCNTILFISLAALQRSPPSLSSRGWYRGNDVLVLFDKDSSSHKRFDAGVYLLEKGFDIGGGGLFPKRAYYSLKGILELRQLGLEALHYFSRRIAKFFNGADKVLAVRI